MTGKSPLAGVRVLDFTLVWAGSFGVMLLSDMGAEIIRVESCQHHIINTRGTVPKPSKEQVSFLGAHGRLYADLDPKDDPWNRHATFNGFGRNRYSMTVDLRQPEGQEIVRDLARISDIIIDNNTVGLLDRFGLDYKTIHSINPTLVYITMPIYGLAGPYKDYLGFGLNAEAISGLTSLRAHAGADPSSAGGTNHMDASSGVGVAFAAMVALHERERTGVGKRIEFCQIEHMLHQTGEPLMDAAMNGRARTGLGNRDAVRAPQGIYPCLGDQRWIALSVGDDNEWAGLCKTIGQPEMASAPEYHGNPARQARHDHLDREISAWTATQEAREAMRILQEHGVPAGLVSTDKDVYEDPHLEDRGFFHWMEHPACGTHRYPGHSFQYSGTPLRFDTPAPLLGQHNDLVYRQLLGLPPAKVQRLVEQGHIGDRYTDEAVKGA